MSNKTVEFTLKLNGLNTIADFENYLEEINGELKSMDTNSQAFAEMSKLARQADGQVKTLNQSLEGVTSGQKADGLLKLGEGLAGAFAAGSVAAGIFGEKASAGMEKTLEKVGSLVVALDGVKKVTEALSSENLKNVKGAVDGFKKSGIAAKLFGNATKSAIAATGIGLLIIAIGLIVANFDKVKEAVLGTFKPLADWIDRVQEKFGSFKNILSGIGAAIKAAFQFKDPAEAFRKAIETGKELETQTENYNSLYDERIKKHEREIKLLETKGGKEKEILQKNIQYSNEMIASINDYEKALVATGKKLDDNNIQLREGLQLEKEIAQIKLKNLKDDVTNKLIADRKKLTDEAKSSIKELEKEVDDLIKQANEESLDISNFVPKKLDFKIDADVEVNVDTKQANEELEEFGDTWSEVAEYYFGEDSDWKDYLAVGLASLGSVMDSIFEFQNIASQNRIDQMNYELETFRVNNEAMVQERIAGYEESADQWREIQDELNEREMELREEQKDAEGDRYAELSEEIATIQTQKDEAKKKEDEDKAAAAAADKAYQNELIKRENAIKKAQYEQAKKEKKQSIITAIINTALGIVTAFANNALPLAIVQAALAAAAGAASIATISSQQVPQPVYQPELKYTGGYTKKGGKYEPVGIVHAGEWVANQELVNHPRTAPMIEQLESIRKNGFADGGYTTSQPNSAQSTIAMDYTAFGNAVSDAIRSNPMYVSVTEFRDVENRLKVVETRSSI